MGNARKQKELRRARRKEREVQKASKPRECGGCTSCCTAPSIPEIPSPAGEHCKHECATGCAIYETRPARCQGFRCVWLDGWGAKADRPDKLGWFAYVDLSFPELNVAAGGGSSKGAILMARETVPGALQSARFAEALRDWLRRRSAVAVHERSGDGRESLTLYGPKIPRGVQLKREFPADPSSPG